jgi:hypothetical protein
VLAPELAGENCQAARRTRRRCRRSPPAQQRRRTSRPALHGATAGSSRVVRRRRRLPSPTLRKHASVVPDRRANWTLGRQRTARCRFRANGHGAARLPRIVRPAPPGRDRGCALLQSRPCWSADCGQNPAAASDSALTLAWPRSIQPRRRPSGTGDDRPAASPEPSHDISQKFLVRRHAPEPGGGRLRRQRRRRRWIASCAGTSARAGSGSRSGAGSVPRTGPSPRTGPCARARAGPGASTRAILIHADRLLHALRRCGGGQVRRLRCGG